MKTTSIPFIFFGFIIMSVSLLIAETDTVFIDFQKCIQRALSTSEDIRVGNDELLKAKSDIIKAYSYLLPHANGTVNYQHSWAINKNPVPNFLKSVFPSIDNPDYLEIDAGLRNTFSYGIIIDQPILSSGLALYSIRAAKFNYEAVLAALSLKKDNIIFQAAEGYYSCLLSEEMVKVQEQAYLQSQENLSIVSKMFEVQVVSEYEMKRVEVEIANNASQLATMKIKRNSMLKKFRSLIHMPDDTTLIITDNLDSMIDSIEYPSVESNKKNGLINRPELKALINKIQASKMSIGISRSYFLPKLSGRIGFTHIAQTNKNIFSKNDFSNGLFGSFMLEIPIFDGLSTVQGFKKEKLDYAVLLLEKRKLENSISLEIDTIFNNIQIIDEQRNMMKKTVFLAEEALQLANEMYKQGKNTLLDVMSSRIALVQAKTNYYSSLCSLRLALLNLDRATGQLSIVHSFLPISTKNIQNK